MTQTIEIEFPTQGRGYMAATLALSRLGRHLARDTYRVEMLARTHGQLVDAWSPFASEASTFAFRVHLAPMASWEWRRFQASVLHPLAHHGVEVRSPIH